MSDTPHFRQLTVIGVGLIGGSLARALRTAKVVDKIVGCGRDEENLKKALELGVIDEYHPEVSDAVRGADLVVVAVPLGVMDGVFAAIIPALEDDAIVTDVGSAKESVLLIARQAFAERLPCFVPGHPIAGTERSGVEASIETLFADHSVILTPIAETDKSSLKRVHAMWQAAGATTIELDAVHHDEVLAATSHLPHLLAYSLVNTLVDMDDSEEIFKFAAGGFRDFTRIASSNPEMWRDICLANRESILKVLMVYMRNLESLRDMLVSNNSAEIRTVFDKSKAARDRHLTDGVQGRE